MFEGPPGEPMYPRPSRAPRRVRAFIAVLSLGVAACVAAVYYGCVDLHALGVQLPSAHNLAVRDEELRDGVPHDGVAILEAAARRLETLNRETLAAEKRLPKLAFLREAPILSAIWSKPSILGHGPYTAKDIGALEQIVQIEANVGLVYAEFRQRPGLKPDHLANAVAYQDELVSTVVFNDAAYAGLIDAITDYVTKHEPQAFTPDQLSAFARVQRLVNENTHSLFEELAMPLRSENVDRLIAALVANAPTYAAAATPDERRDNARRIQAVARSRTREQRSNLETAADAMKVDGCVGLCAMHSQL